MKLRRRNRDRPSFQALVEHSPVAMYVSATERAGRYHYVSPALVELLGWTPEEWKADPDLFEKALHPEDCEHVLGQIAVAKANRRPYHTEYRLIDKDGATIWVEDTAVPDGDCWQGFLVDITQRKAAERRYRALVEQLPLITYIDSPDRGDGAPIYMSPQVESMLGYTPREWQATPSFFLEHVHPDDRETVVASQEEALRTGEPLVREFRFVAKDGRVVWLHDIQTVVRDDQGRPWYSQGFALDVTSAKFWEQERERLLRRAQMQNERLRELDRMKDEFIALVSHELRTPLTSIRGYVELLEDDRALSPAERSAFLQVIDRNADRLQRLVEDLLLAAQAEANSLNLHFEEIDLAKLVVDCVEASAPNAAAREIALACTVQATPAILGDAGRLAQVVDNLLSNALKFTPEGGGVHVRVSESESTALIEVADSGMGIPAGEQSELFGRFFRTSSAQREAIGGVGLGLSITKSLVEAHGGRIGVHSTEGVGTTFTVHLPLAAAEERVSGAA
ncbi:MAG: PAS domain-containing protein [Actinobacteria bacterium]|nr:PAS domain-containing protein [Actinomycetota bacterium]